MYFNRVSNLEVQLNSFISTNFQIDFHINYQMGMKVLSIKTKSLEKISIIICIVIRYLQKLSISVQHQLLKKNLVSRNSEQHWAQSSHRGSNSSTMSFNVYNSYSFIHDQISKDFTKTIKRKKIINIIPRVHVLGKSLNY